MKRRGALDAAGGCAFGLVVGVCATVFAQSESQPEPPDRARGFGRTVAFDAQRLAARAARHIQALESAKPSAPLAPSATHTTSSLPRPPPLLSPAEEATAANGAELVTRDGPGLPGWWYGASRPRGDCVIGSLYTRTDRSGLFVCGKTGWTEKGGL